MEINKSTGLSDVPHWTRHDGIEIQRRAQQSVASPRQVARSEQVPETNDPKRDDQLNSMVDSINSKLSRVNQRLDLYVVEGTHEVAARIVDTQSNEIVKEIPPSELLELRSRLAEMVGLLFDEGV